MATVRSGATAVAGFAAAAILGAATLVGCSDGARFEQVSDRIDTSSSDEAANAGGASEAASALLAGGSKLGEQTPDAEAGREVISTGSLTVLVDDAPGAGQEAAAIAEDMGGFLARSDAELDGDRRVTVTLRVPAEDFDEAMERVGALGEVRRRNVDTEDVTDQVVDLEGRLENARASTERLRELLVEAEDVQHVIAIEDRLTQRETEIEALAGQLEVLEDQVALATIEVELTEDDEPEVSDDLPGPAEALRAGAVAVANIAQGLVAVAAFLVPFLPFLLVGWWLVRRGRRRRAERRRASLPPPPPGSGETPADTALGDVPSGP